MKITLIYEKLAICFFVVVTIIGAGGGYWPSNAGLGILIVEKKQYYF